MELELELELRNILVRVELDGAVFDAAIKAAADSWASTTVL
jgi:hypothetical protein